MMLIQTWLWFTLLSKNWQSGALLLMDSEQNYSPPEPKDETFGEGNDASREISCPILYPHYPYIFGLNSNEQGFQLKCKKLEIRPPTNDNGGTLGKEADILQNSQEIERKQETSDSHKLNINTNNPTEAREKYIPHIGDTEEIVNAKETQVPKTESDIERNYISKSLDGKETLKTESEPYIVKAVPRDKTVPLIDGLTEEEQIKELQKATEVEQSLTLKSSDISPGENSDEQIDEQYAIKENETTTGSDDRATHRESIVSPVPTVTKLGDEKPIPVNPSFKEWTLIQEQKNRQEEERRKEEEREKRKQIEQQSHSGASNSSKPISSIRMKKNFASPDCGAKVVDSNAESQGSGNIISMSKDEYMLNKCIDRGWFVVELCDNIKAFKFEIANFELFSSVFKKFRVSLSSSNIPGKWALFGEFEAQELRGLQTFENKNGVFGKFVKVEILSHYGTEHYCPISQFKIYGLSEVEIMDADDDDQDPSQLIDTDVKSEQEEADNTPNVIKIIQRKVGETIENIKGVFTAQDQVRDSVVEFPEGFNGSTIFGTTFKYEIICPGCDTERLQETRLLVSEDFDDLLKTLKNPSLRFELTNKICNSYGFNITSKLQSTCLGDRLVEFFKVLFGTSRITALCNVIAWQEGLLNEVVIHPNIPSPKDTHIESGVTNIKPSVGANEINPAPKETEPLSESANLKATILADDKDMEPVETLNRDGKASEGAVTIDNNNIQTDDTSSSKPDNIIPSPTVNKGGEKHTSHVQQTDQSEGEAKQDKLKEPADPPRVVHVPPADKSQTGQTNGREDSGGSGGTKKPADSSTNAGTTPTHRDTKEGVWLKLANRIKNLERNVNLSGGFLEELSVRYKKQIEDLQLAVKKSNEALSLSSKYRQQERIAVNQLSAEVSNLTERVTNLTANMEAISVGAIYFHAFFLIMEIFLGFFFLFVCCRRWKSSGMPHPATSAVVTNTKYQELKVKEANGDVSFPAIGITEIGSQSYSNPNIQQNSSLGRETSASSSSSVSPTKQNKRRHSLEDLFAINEEGSGHGDISQNMANGRLSQVDRRKSMVVLSEPPPLTRKQRKRQHRKQAQLAHTDHRPQSHLQPNILSENRVEDINSCQQPNSSNPNSSNIFRTPLTSGSSPYHTIHSPPESNSPIPLTWKQVVRSESVDNLYQTGSNGNDNNARHVNRNNHYVQAEPNSRFVVQPVVNVYLNSMVGGNPLETSNKYDLLNNSLHDDPTPFKERSLNYGLETSCNVVENRSEMPMRHKSKSKGRKKQLFPEPLAEPTENGEMRISVHNANDDKTKKYPTPHAKLKRSKSSSPKRVGKTAKQRVLFENFNPDNADWIRGADNIDDGT